MDTADWMVASSSAQRLPQKTSGPFNTDLTGVTESVTSVDDFMSFSLFSDEERLLGLSPPSLHSLDDNLSPTMIKAEQATNSDSLLDLNDLKGTFGLDLENSSDFLENFTDLSNYFLDDEAMDTTDMTNTVALDESVIMDEVFQSLTTPSSVAPTPAPTPVTVEEVKKGRKRKTPATVAMTTPMATPSLEAPDDHSYTATNVKRARINSDVTVSDTFSDAGSDCEGSSTSKAPKEQKYQERRRKNNIASRRSRETRKQKFSHMEERAIELEKANKELRDRVTQLEELAKEMKDALVKRLAQSK